MYNSTYLHCCIIFHLTTRTKIIGIKFWAEPREETEKGVWLIWNNPDWIYNHTQKSALDNNSIFYRKFKLLFELYLI